MSNGGLYEVWVLPKKLVNKGNAHPGKSLFFEF